MNSVSKSGVKVYRGRLGFTIKGQTGKWAGNLPPTHERGYIEKFSRKSRRRLRETLANADTVEKSSIFGFCFTIPGEVLSPEKTRHLWHTFVLGYKNKFPQFPLIWRIELQTRKQAHWHCVCFIGDKPNSDGFILPAAVWAQFIKFEWQRVVWSIVGALDERTARGFEKHGVDIKVLDESSATGIIGYLCDHTSKHKQDQLGWKGRQWGVVNKGALVKRSALVLTADDSDHIKAARQFRRLQEHLRAEGKYTGVRVTPSGNVSTAIFGRDAERLLKCYLMTGSLSHLSKTA